MPSSVSERCVAGFKRASRKVFGAPRPLNDPSLFHRLSLIPLLAWIGLGADGLSSSSYGPEEAFRTLGAHTYLALPLALAAALTVFIIAYSYSRIIEHFPHGGGGYVVATHTLGKQTGVISGCALLVDYVLTISVSIAACGDALFSFIPLAWHSEKILFEAAAIVILVILNMRGVKESVIVLAPIFLVFLGTHVFLLAYGVASHLPEIGPVARTVGAGFREGLATLGLAGMLALFLRAFSLGGGTYTGIEAVSNGLQVMREPRAQTGKRTMLYMSVSLALTAGGLLFCYLLINVRPTEGRTLNAVLADALFGGWSWGWQLALVTILSEGALLVVAAQAGFIDGPRVMATMAVDSWLPHRFAALSERLSMRNGILLMGGAALAILWWTRGAITTLVVMYSINVFLTFSLSQLGMARYFITHRKRDREWKRHLAVHAVCFVVCATILAVTSWEKFADGGWLTLAITALVIVLCHLIRRHYLQVRRAMVKLDRTFSELPPSHTPPPRRTLDPDRYTAIQLVSGFNGFGKHTFLSIVRNFPGFYKQFLFVGVAVVDSGTFKGARELENLEASTTKMLQQYVELARQFGFPAEYRLIVGTDVVETATERCEQLGREFPRSTVFAGQLTFRLEKFYHRLLHNQTSFAIQRRLQWRGLTSVILPIRVEL